MVQSVAQQHSQEQYGAPLCLDFIIVVLLTPTGKAFLYLKESPTRLKKCGLLRVNENHYLVVRATLF